MAFKLAIAVLTAHHPSRWHRRQILREQCLKNCSVPYKFVFGDAVRDGDWDVTGIPEEEILHAPGSDLKKYLHIKNQAAFRWALDLGADAIMRIMDDTWVYPDRILNAGLEAFDYAGHFPCKFKLGGTFSFPFSYLSYAHGGCGIWLSRKAMEMLVADVWDEHYMDSWPEKMDVGFGLQFPKPPHYWDDQWVGEVLQGNLPYGDPLRAQPWEAYARNGISIFEDAMLFENSEPMRALCIHDPGVHKLNDGTMDDLMEQIKVRNVAGLRVEAVPELQTEETSRV